MWLSKGRCLALAIVALPLCSFASNELYKAKDWVIDNTFTQGIEGPAVDKHGLLYAVNFAKEGTIGRVTSKNTAELYIQLPKNSVGNGIRFDKQGNMYIADYVNHNILIIDTNTQKKLSAEQRTAEVYAHSSLMNQPNDIAIMDNGVLFASDPNWANSSGKLWRINKKQDLILLEENMGTTNGIEVSPDDKTLYVNESVQRNIWRYELDEQGGISNKSLLIHFADFGLDGM